jgi:signal recognition particle GTPase
MKKNHLRCLHCQKPFESRRSDAKFCSNVCRTNAYLARHNKEKPAFLNNQKENKPPQKAALSGVESTQTHRVEQRQVSNPEWVRVEAQTNLWRNRHDELLRERAKAMEKYNRAVKSNNRLTTTIVGAGLGAGAVSFGEEKPKTEDVAWGAVIGGFLGRLFGSEETDAEFQKRLRIIASEVSEIDRRIMQVESIFRVHINALRKIPRYFVKSVLIPQTEQINLELPTLENAPEKARKSEIMNSADIAGMQFDTWPLTGPWADFLGEPQKKFSALIYGSAGAGKSTFALRLAHYFAENHGKVLFIASEEGVNKSLRDKINLYNLQSQNLLIGVPPERNFEGTKKFIEANQSPFVFIDSVNHLQISAKEIEELRKKYPKIAFVMVFQATKQGQIKGSTEYTHNADIVVKVEKLQAYTEKNRYSTNKTLSIATLSSLEQFI